MARFEIDFLLDYSEDSLLAEVRRVAAEVNKPVLTKADFARHGRVSANTLMQRFGDWQSVLQRAGMGRLYSGRSVSQRMRDVDKTRRLTNEDIVCLIREANAKLGHTPLRREFESESGISGSAIVRRFGSWDDAVRAAGLERNPKGFVRYSDEMCYENLLAVWTHYARRPTAMEMNRPPSIINRQTYGTRWGSWRKALTAFVEWANAEEAEEAQSHTENQIVKEAPAAAKRIVRPRDRREIPLRLRWRVLQRDRFRCVACGRGPATHLNVDLHVDHIMPVVKGGKTLIENLRSLCKDCNTGKGDLLPE